MKKNQSLKSVFQVFGVAFLLALCNSGLASAAGPGASPDAAGEINVLKQTSRAFSSIARKAIPAVVFIKVEKTYTQSGHYACPGGQAAPDYELFDFFFRGRGAPESYSRQFRLQGQGTGFIISKDGYILTNNHIVGDASRITVKLHDGREFEAQNVGSDPRSEVAVIKIKGADFPCLEFGNSDEIEIGEWVIAIGNPFGLSETLTVGVVSAKGRNNLGLTDYEDFIQTDAAINPGNSGGPLLNIDGRVIGINTAIFSQTGGSMGIGFAIPIKMAVAIKDQLIAGGKVLRGYLGVAMQDITPDLADSMGLAGNIRGVLVAEVARNSAAEQAGIKPGDVILKFAGRPVENASALRNQVAMSAPGTTVKANIISGGKETEISIKISAQSGGAINERVARADNPLGVTVEDLNDAWSRRFGYEPGSGVIVTGVRADSPAQGMGISPGDLICNVNRRPAKTVADFNSALAMSEKSGLVLLLVKNQEGSRFLTARLK